MKEGKNVLVVAHGNMMHLEDISVKAIPEIEIPTATPKLNEFDRKMKIIRAIYLKRLQNDSLALSHDTGLVL